MCQFWRPGWGEFFPSAFDAVRVSYKSNIPLLSFSPFSFPSRDTLQPHSHMKNLAIDDRNLMFYFARLLSKSSNTSI